METKYCGKGYEIISRLVPCGMLDNPPVISVHGADVICYGGDITEYFENEFGERLEEAVKLECTEFVSFWTEIM